MTTHATVIALAALAHAPVAQNKLAWRTACEPARGVAWVGQKHESGFVTSARLHDGERPTCPRCLVLIDAALEGRFLVQLPEVKP